MTLRTRQWLAPAVVAATALVSAGCGMANADYDGFDPGGVIPECFSSNECPAGSECSEFGTCVAPGGDAPDAPLPEEAEFELGTPVSSNRYLYVAMTELDSLARIDGATLGVSSLSVGERPRVVATAPATDLAVVLDSINATATIVRPLADRDDKKVFKTLPSLNRVVIDPTSTYAVAWFDLNQAVAEAGSLAAVSDVGSFQDVTVLRLGLDNATSVDFTVGFRPRSVTFDSTGSHAYVVTEDGISVIDLPGVVDAGPGIAAPISITGDPLIESELSEVAVVSTGHYAVARNFAESQLYALALEGGNKGLRWQIPLPGPATDVDLSVDGTKAYAVVRDTAQLAIVDLDAGDPGAVTYIDVTGENIGSLTLSADGVRGVLYTNVSAIERISVVELGDDNTVSSFGLQKSVRWVAFAPTGDRLLVSHAKSPPEDTADVFDAFIDESYGYSIFDVATGFAKLQLTEVDVGNAAFSPNGDKAFVSLAGLTDYGEIAELQVLELDSGVVRPIALGSAPEAVGILPAAGVAFVSQEHALGRVSFIDLATDGVQTLTGFDLNSQVID